MLLCANVADEVEVVDVLLLLVLVQQRFRRKPPVAGVAQKNAKRLKKYEFLVIENTEKKLRNTSSTSIEPVSSQAAQLGSSFLLSQLKWRCTSY